MIILKNGRLAFPAIFTPKAFSEGDDPDFHALFLIQKEDKKQLGDLVKEIHKVATVRWKDKASAILKKLSEDDRLALHMKPKTNEVGEIYEGFKDCVYVSARNKARPWIVGRRNEVLTESDGIIYAGCYVNACIEFWAQDNKWGKRINASLLGVQFVADGDAFGGASRLEESPFEALEKVDEPASEDEPEQTELPWV